jgi:uncharacterized protein YecE (DUF72 family)
MAGSIHIGTSGWSYKHWREIYYPKEVKAKDYLSYFSKEFKTAEINTSFYHLPKPETVEHWIASVNSRFRFCPKISRYVTHMKKLNDPEETLTQFFGVFDPYVKHLGPVLLQLPPNLPFHADKADHFFKVLKQYKGYRFCIEPRHETWLEDDAIELLKKHKIGFVIAESGDRWPYGEFVTAKDIYIRFHGPDGSYASSYPDKVLKQYAKKILAWKEEGHHIWIYFNNDGNGYAIDNARTLITLTQQ